MPYNPFMGEIMYVAGSFAPKNWAVCNGQILNVVQYQALFSLLGTTYGGNGSTTFGLPDLRGRAIMGGGTSVAGFGTTTTLGTIQGTEQVTLQSAQMPLHAHTLSVTNAAGTTAAPTAGSSSLATSSGTGSSSFTVNMYAPALTGGAPMGLQTISFTGSGVPHENRQPYNTLTACICLYGIFPSRS